MSRDRSIEPSDGSPVDEALDRLIDYAGWATTPKPHKDAVATVREALERQREERDKAWAAFNNAEDAHDDTKQKLWRDRGLMLDLQQRAESAEAEVRRLTEGLRETEDVLSSVGNWLAGSPAPTAAFIEAIDLRIGKNRALLAASPTDGGGT